MISIKWNGDNYYLEFQEWTLNYILAKLFFLSLKEYQNILINNGAFLSSINGECYFVNKKDAKKAVEVLESIYILNKLTE